MVQAGFDGKKNGDFAILVRIDLCFKLLKFYFIAEVILMHG